MATTQNTYTGNGSTTNYSFTFPYLKTTDIKVSLDAVVTTAYSLSNATTINFSTAPANGVAIRIYRDTDVDVLEATFNPGSAIKAEDLNNNFEQNNYSVQESKAQASQAPTALANSIAAVNTANQASADATSALSSVTSVVSSIVVADVAGLNAINTSGYSNGDMVDVSDSTGIESVITGEPAGFVGATDLRVRVSWNGTGWTYQRYEATDPDSRYILDGTNTVSYLNLASNAVRTSQIQDDAVTADKLADTAVTAASYTYASVTVDAQGRLTAASNGTTPLTSSDIGSTVQAYDADTAKLDVPQTFTASQIFTASQTFTADLTFTASQTFPKIPANTQTSAYNLVLSDAGKHINITTGGITVPSGIFSTGDAISVYNNSGSDQTITQGSNVTLRKVGTADTGNRTLAQYGLVTILCVASNTFVVVGGGLT